MAATARSSPVEVRRRVAGKVLALRFASPALAAKLTAAFAHLESAEDASADLVICCWDDVSSGGSLAAVMPETGRSGLDYVHGSVRLAWGLDDRSLQAYDPVRRIALFWVPDAAKLEAWEQGAPFRRILHW